AHLGLFLDRPTIGCAKSRLIGAYDEPKTNKGNWSPLYDKTERIGAVVRTRTEVMPLFISVGNQCTLEDAIKTVLQWTSRYRLPEPTRLAHQKVTDMRSEINFPSEYFQYQEETDKFLFKNKTDKEKWVVREFLSVLGIDFSEEELISVKDVFPDIVFKSKVYGSVEFEVKEIIEKDRKPHKEIKKSLEKAKTATSASDFLTPYRPKKIDFQEIVKRIDEIIIKNKTCQDVTEKINLLLYENFTYTELNESFQIPHFEEWKKWRSVSMIGNRKDCRVFWASETAPDFIKRHYKDKQ
ncbi:MAG: endonuclease V, partial [Sedimentisphaerales bacterium]|nr:endonuclease V [Sedimentisphaerales bacterium]